MPGAVVSSSGGGTGGGGGGGFFWTWICTGVDSTGTTDGVPKLISRPRMSDGVGTIGSVMSSSQLNSKMFLMPLGIAMPVFRHMSSNLEMLASSLGATDMYCRYSSRLLFMSLMLLEHAYC